MPHFSIKDLMKIGQPIGLQANFKATGVSTDSRTIQSGDLFFALQGPQFDGHAYVDTAISKGASACVVSQTWWQQSGSPETKPFVVVDNTLHALQQLATNHRSTYRGPVVAITGTNGKTSCKEMTAAVMSTTYKTLATTGNLNNEIGVPLTLLRIEDDTEMVILEMGADKKGDIAALCQIAKPDSGLITNIGNAHLQSFGDIETIAATKSELFEALKDDGVRFVNVDDPRLAPHASMTKGLVTFSMERDADYRGAVESVNASACVKLRVTSIHHESFTAQLSIPGIHQAKNALMAGTLGFSMGVSEERIATALETFSTTNNRMSVRRVNDIIVIDDSYNANPESMKAALETLMAMTLPGRRIAVLSDMLELGDDSEKLHTAVGEYIRRKSPHAVFLTGVESKHMFEAARTVKNIFYYPVREELIHALKSFLRPDDVVLVKGSRGMRMENVIEAL